MKKMFRDLIVALALLALATLNPQLSTAFAQGSLTPPGAPAPTMKSLDQIEARTAITNTTSLVTISQPGSYYLTHNLTVSTGDGIDITTNGVTLDLNGFTISSTAASATGTGILLGSGLSEHHHCQRPIQGGVTNNGSGVYGGGGFAYGIYYSGNSPVNVLVSRVSVSGCRYYGIFLNSGDSTVVEACTVRTVGSYGILLPPSKAARRLIAGTVPSMATRFPIVAGKVPAAATAFTPPPRRTVTAKAAAATAFTPVPRRTVTATVAAAPAFTPSPRRTVTAQ